MSDTPCPHCSKSISPTANYCPECGKRQNVPARTPLSLKWVASILAIAGGLFAFAWVTQYSIAGKKPTKTHDQIAAHPPESQAATTQAPPMTMAQIKIPNANLEPFRAATEESPTDVESWRNLSQAIIEEMKGAAPNDRQALTVEYIQALSQIRKLDPEDKEAVRILADLSFQQGVFDKAAQMYEVYLKLDPADRQVKAKLASTYTFLGRYDESEQLLTAILEDDPENFQAHAYLAITFAQRGDKANAIKQGEIALRHSPSEEATNRFGAFLQKLKDDAIEQNGPQ